VTWKHALSKAKYCGKLNLVDLAGSERLSKYQSPLPILTDPSTASNPHTFALQERLRERETLLINQSLTTLGKVFLALAPTATPPQQQYVPYRDSKLTHFLKDSLGGESKTMLIVQVSPCGEDSLESLSSLQFGARVQMIEKGEIRANIIPIVDNGDGSQNRKKSRSKSRVAAGKKDNISLLE
jgi:Kinesin motor domain